MIRVLIVGIGGVGGYLLPLLLQEKVEISAMDADVVEKKNLKRQNYTADDIGKAKVNCFEGINPLECWFDEETNIEKYDFVFICVDNDKARRDIISALDKAPDTYGIFCANELNDSDAMLYHTSFKKKATLDPRIFAPYIFEKDDGPSGSHCIEDNDEEEDQTTAANMQAALFGLNMFKYYRDVCPEDINKFSIYSTKCGGGIYSTERIKNK